MKQSISLKTLSILVFMAAILSFTSGTSLAIPSANFLYYETNLGASLWRYDYTLYNTSDPIIDLGYDLYYVAIEFAPAATFTLLSLPTGWDKNTGSGFAEAFSINPGTPPIGKDIAPGTSLTGFSFQFDYQAGNLPFLAYLTNPNDPSNPIPFSGNTAPVPLPATFILLASGLVGLGFLRGRKLFKS